jgi:hypothetical protein
MDQAVWLPEQIHASARSRNDRSPCRRAPCPARPPTPSRRSRRPRDSCRVSPSQAPIRLTSTERALKLRHPVASMRWTGSQPIPQETATSDRSSTGKSDPPQAGAPSRLNVGHAVRRAGASLICRSIASAVWRSGSPADWRTDASPFQSCGGRPLWGTVVPAFQRIHDPSTSRVGWSSDRRSGR